NGVPNIAYRAGGVAGVIRHEEDGMLIKCGDVPALTEGMLRLVNDEKLRHRLGQTGMKRVAQAFRWEDKLTKVRDVYLDLMQSRSPAPGGPGSGSSGAARSDPQLTSAAHPSS